MFDKNYYDVTNWDTGNPYEDIGEVLNSIIADIKRRQSDSDYCEGGKPGADNLYSIRGLSSSHSGGH